MSSALGISAHTEDLDRLREIFRRLKWKFHEARSCREASVVLCSYRMPIIICDRALPDGTWMDILSLTAPLLESPRVIVMSASFEGFRSSEVLDMSGYGVLAKPLDESEVTRTLLAAHRSWHSARDAAPLLAGAAVA
jgi:DNA-binding response OmpR family regulator